MTSDPSQPEAGPSKLTAGPSPFHESSQFRHWRYSPAQLAQVRQALNEKSVEVVERNTRREKEAQEKLGHSSTDPPPPTAYLSVEDELLLLRFYCSQASAIARQAFGLPEVVEGTAISYLKRFYLKNSVMEWHPKAIMPTCLYLAAKTTNLPIPAKYFVTKVAKLQEQDILDTEFVLAQSLAFEFWVRGPEKSLRGWALELQEKPNASIDAIQKALPQALTHLSTSRLTDAEFVYSPSQISLACYRMADKALIDDFLDWRYTSLAEADGDDEPGTLAYGMEKDRLVELLGDLEGIVRNGEGEVDMKKVKEVDKRLKMCSNPEKVPGTALYTQRKQQIEADAAAVRAEKSIKIKREMSEREMVFGDVIQPKKIKVEPASGSTLGSPRVSAGVDRGIDQPVFREPDGKRSGMGVADEGMGLLVGGEGLKDVGILPD